MSARPPAKPRRRIIGPFFLLAVVIAALLIVREKLPSVGRSSGPADAHAPVMVEHHVAGAPAAEPAVAPSPDLVNEHAAELELTAEQRAQLQPLVEGYHEKLAPLEQEMMAALQLVKQFQAAQPDRPHLSAAQIQAQMAEVSAVSGRMAALRRSYWAKVSPLLTDGQRERSRQLWVDSIRLGAGPHVTSESTPRSETGH